MGYSGETHHYLNRDEKSTFKQSTEKKEGKGLPEVKRSRLGSPRDDLSQNFQTDNETESMRNNLQKRQFQMGESVVN